jgi:HEAT repeat protein
VIRSLGELPPECTAELRTVARQLLEHLPGGGESAVAAVLEALTARRDPAVGDLLVDALKSTHTAQKEDYVSMLEEIDRFEDAVAGLLAVLSDGARVPRRPDLAVTIRALHSLRFEQAVPLLLGYVNHPERAVRGTAIEFLYNFADGEKAGPLFADRLAHEPEPQIAEMLIDSLTSWEKFPDERFLRETAADPAQPDSLRKSARRALAYGLGESSAVDLPPEPPSS